MEPERLGTLIDRHADALALYARQWADAPEDVVQEAFVKLAGLPIDPDEPAAWLYRAVRNAAINAGIAGRRRRKREAEAAAGADPWFEPDSATADGIDPEAARAALSGLPAEQREVVVAHLWGGLSFEQVAAAVGSSASTVHRRYQAGLATLRDLLEVPCRPTRNPR